MVGAAIVSFMMNSGCGKPSNSGGGDMSVKSGFGGTLLLTNMLSKQPSTGAMIRQLLPVVGFSPAGAVHHDYDDRNGGVFGCVADHFSGGRTLGSDSDAGTVKITMYSASTFMDGTQAPSEIDCARVMAPSGDTLYKCGYGPLVNGKPGLTINSPYPPSASLLHDKQTVRFQLAGGADIGTVDTATDVSAVDAPAITEDLSIIKYDPSADTSIHVSCPTETCGFMTAVSIVVNQNTPDAFDQPSATSGVATCVNLGNDTAVIKKEAIAAMLAGDTQLKTVQTSVVRFGLPTNESDAGNSTLQFGAGGGAIGYAPR
jgi:hypothetical protein